MSDTQGNNTNPTPFMEEIVNNNKELLKELDESKDFKSWYETIQKSEKANASLNQDLLSFLVGDEWIPGEQSDADFTYLNNRYQMPFSSKMLRNAGRTESARLIKNTRSLQFTSFGKPSSKKSEPGLVVEFADPNYKPTQIEKENIRQFTYQMVDKFFFCPFEDEGNLTKWLGVAYNDFFDLDDITFEIRRTLSGKPLGFHLTDPTIVYHVIPKGRKYQRWDYNADSYSEKRPRDISKEIKYVLEKNNIRAAGFTRDKMIKSHFFISSDFMTAYRGYSIVEQGIRMILNIMNSITYNSSNFNNNRTPMGIFAFTGGFTNRVLTEQFKKVLYSYLSGANNRYRLPVIGLPERGDAKFIPFNMNSREMEFHLWMTLLFTILCQLSGTNPEEISMSSHESAMVGKKLFDTSPDGILQVSKDKGLNTFLRYTETIINKSGVLKQMTGYNVVCKFNGLEVEDERVKVEVKKSLLATTRSYNDIIVEEGGEPQKIMFGDVNIYDVKGVDSQQIFGALQARIQAIDAEKQQLMAQQQQGMAPDAQGGAQGGSQAQQGSMTKNDNKLTSKYGQPENSGTNNNESKTNQQ